MSSSIVITPANTTDTSSSDRYTDICGLRVDQSLHDLIDEEVLPELGLETKAIWRQLADIVHDLAPKNKELLLHRETLQHQIDQYHRAHRPTDQDKHSAFTSYKTFLKEIGYLESNDAADTGPPSKDVQSDYRPIKSNHADTEISSIAGPQLVVPINNARFALNAANARWGSLYDALYGTDAIPNTLAANDSSEALIDELARGSEFNSARGRAAIAWANDWLDTAVPLEKGYHHQVHTYELNYDASGNTAELMCLFSDGTQTSLKDPSQLRAYSESLILLQNHGLHIELHIDADHTIGRLSLAGVKDVVIESAISTICDCEDSISAVDGADKTAVYRNWLGLMRGDLSAAFSKGGKTHTRRLNHDHVYTALDGHKLVLAGRSLLLIRNVGHLMTTPAVLYNEGNESSSAPNSEIPEGILDAFVTSLIALHDLRKLTTQTNDQNTPLHNSRTGSIYIVKPKMHGSEEVAFSNELFGRVEQALGLATNTIKMGIMDEERRTTVNLQNCINAAKDRVIFINTGFLDRTGDEIHTSMEAGPFLPKEAIKQQPWIKAYEDNNVDAGLASGLNGKAQIGKGMWAMPDQMAQMLAQKQAHLEAGASCAWVPSPTAATLHATHYHRVNVAEVQQKLQGRTPADLDAILTIPLIPKGTHIPADQIQLELDNNAQSILGYVVRWVDQGVGCSKVPDINHVGMMEDRATLRISSQLLANWLHHGLCSTAQMNSTFKKMAVVVDKQNAQDQGYISMAPSFSGIAYLSALALVFEGRSQPSGYTEPLLHAYRQRSKART